MGSGIKSAAGGWLPYPQEHLLLLELLGNIVGRGPRDLNPDLGEEGAGRQHEDDVEDAVEGVGDGLGEGSRGRHVVDKASDRDHLAAHVHLVPGAEELDELVATVVLVEELGDEVEVGDKGRLQDDGHVGGVEQLDWVRLLGTTLALGANRQVHAEALHCMRQDGGQIVRTTKRTQQLPQYSCVSQSFYPFLPRFSY